MSLCTMFKTVAIVALVSLSSVPIWAQGQTTTTYLITYANTFKPIADSDGSVDEWRVVSNWQRGSLTSTSSSTETLTGGVPGIPNGNLAPLVVDGFIIGDSIMTIGGYKIVDAPHLEGWEANYGAFNGAHLKIESLAKIQGGSPRWDVDETSKITLTNPIPSGRFEVTLTFHVKSEAGVTFSTAPIATGTLNLNLYQQGSVQYDGALNIARSHVIKSLILNCTDRGEATVVVSRKLIGFASENVTATFSVDTAGVVNHQSDVTLTRKAEGDVTVADAIGSYSFRKATDGYYIDYVTKPYSTDVTHSATISSATVMWSDIVWDAGQTAPTLGTDNVSLSWADSITSETLTLDLDVPGVLGAITFNTQKPLTVAKSVEGISFIDYTTTAPITFGAGYPTLPNCTSSTITLTSAQTEAVQSVAGKTFTYTGGTALDISPRFQPINGGVINLKGGTYNFVEMDPSATHTVLNIGDTTENPVATTINIPNFNLGTVNATINEGANITIAERFNLSEGENGRTSVLMQTGGMITVNGNESSLNSNGSSVKFGHWNGSSAYTLAGGSFIVPNTAIVMGVTGNTHLFDIVGSTAIATTQGFLLHNSASGSNTLKIRDGGIFNVGAQGVNVNGKVLNFTIDGGSLVASANFSSNAPLTVGAGGAIVDTAAHTVTFSGAVSGTGKLTQAGTGTLAWGNASLPQSVEVGDGSTLSITTATLSMSQVGQKITTIGTGRVQLPETLTIDLAGRDLEAEGTVILISDVDTFTGKTLIFPNLTPGVRLDYPATGTGSITVSYSADRLTTWGSASGDWVNDPAPSPSPWLGGVDFANGKDVVFGDVSDATTATVVVSGEVTPAQVYFANTTTAYTFEDKVEGSKVIGTFDTVGATAPITFNNTVQGKIVVNSDGVTIKKLSPAATTLEVAANRAVTFDDVVWDYNTITKQDTSELILANTVSAGVLTALPWDQANVKATIQRAITIPGTGSLSFNKVDQNYTFESGAVVTTHRLVTSDGSGATTTLNIKEGAKIEVTGNVNRYGHNNESANASIFLGFWHSTSIVNMTGGSFVADDAQIQLGHDSNVTWNQTGGITDVYGLYIPDLSDKTRSFSLSNGTLKVGLNGIRDDVVSDRGFFRLGEGATISFEELSASTFAKPIEVTGAATLLAPNGASLSIVGGTVATTDTSGLTLGDGATASSLTIKALYMAPITVATKSTLIASTDGVTETIPHGLRQLSETVDTYTNDDLIFSQVGVDNLDYLHATVTSGLDYTVTEFTGTFEVKTAGDYTFAGTWDDRIQLKIGDAQIFNSTAHDNIGKGTVTLSADTHEYRIRVFNVGGTLGPSVTEWRTLVMALGWAAGTLNNTTAANYTKFDVGGATDAAIANITPTPVPSTLVYNKVTLQAGSTLAIMSSTAMPLHLKRFAVPAAGGETPAILELRGNAFNDGDVVLTWDPATVTGDISALKLTSEDAQFFLVIDTVAGSASVSKIEVTFTDGEGVTEPTVSPAAQAYIIAMAKANTQPIMPEITGVRISRSDANKAYLLNVIPGFGRLENDTSISVATLDCTFRVTDLQIVGETITATAIINVVDPTRKGEGGLNGALELLSGTELDTIETLVSATSTNLSELTVVAPFDGTQSFYKMRVVER